MRARALMALLAGLAAGEETDPGTSRPPPQFRQPRARPHEVPPRHAQAGDPPRMQAAGSSGAGPSDPATVLKGILQRGVHNSIDAGVGGVRDLLEAAVRESFGARAQPGSGRADGERVEVGPDGRARDASAGESIAPNRTVLEEGLRAALNSTVGAGGANGTSALADGMRAAFGDALASESFQRSFADALGKAGMRAPTAEGKPDAPRAPGGGTSTGEAAGGAGGATKGAGGGAGGGARRASATPSPAASAMLDGEWSKLRAELTRAVERGLDTATAGGAGGAGGAADVPVTEMLKKAARESLRRGPEEKKGGGNGGGGLGGSSQHDAVTRALFESMSGQMRKARAEISIVRRLFIDATCLPPAHRRRRGRHRPSVCRRSNQPRRVSGCVGTRQWRSLRSRATTSAASSRG